MVGTTFRPTIVPVGKAVSYATENHVGITSVEDKVSQTEKGTIRAIVADDFPSMRQALVSCLENIPGVQVVAAAANGQEALQRCATQTPDLVVADLLMPIMNGFQLFKELRKAYPAIRLIAVSGHSSAAIEKEAKAAGADAFIPKNSLPHALIRTVEDLLR